MSSEPRFKQLGKYLVVVCCKMILKAVTCLVSAYTYIFIAYCLSMANFEATKFEQNASQNRLSIFLSLVLPGSLFFLLFAFEPGSPSVEQAALRLPEVLSLNFLCARITGVCHHA